jgi:hypothetical protein
MASVGLATFMILVAGFHMSRREEQAILFHVVLFALATFVAYGCFFVAPL